MTVRCGASKWFNDAYHDCVNLRLISSIISAEVDPDGSHHVSLSSSAMVMPEVAPIADRLNEAVVVAAATAVSTPATAPTSALSIEDASDASDVSSMPSVSVVDHSDGEWDDLRDVPTVSHRSGSKEEYQVVYDSEDDI